MTRYAAVAVPVSNLRGRPVDAAPLNIHDDMQRSQLLFNEPLSIAGEQADWFAVEALEQPRYNPARGWHGYPGWVRKRDVVEVARPPEWSVLVKAPSTTLLTRPSSKGERLFPLSLGTRLLVAGESKGYLEVPLSGGRTSWVARRDTVDAGATLSDDDKIGQNAVNVAHLFLGVSYLWGGRSMPLPWSRGPVMGVDCSGLVNLVFRVTGIELPRDAHDQRNVATPVNADDLSPGDLIFLSREGRPDSFSHVMLSLGGEQFIEAAETGDTVQMRDFREKLGIDLHQLRERDFTAKEIKVCFGRVERKNFLNIRPEG
jgi:gamma-D-glutamyl-L-lysine dipeptidyl-peptidase